MQKDFISSPLADLGALRVRGPDTVRFLQGQLSNDIAQLTLQHSLLAGYHNPQGRAIALLRLVQLEPDDLLAILPRDLASTVASRLSKFVLRAKVKITDDSAGWRVSGLAAPASSDAPEAAGVSSRALPQTLNAQARFEGSVVVRVADRPARWMLISPAAQPSPAGLPADRESWRRLDIAAGQPQIYAATSEEFVAQMLNLDALGAIAFDKGCYTGQEVIARAHYRGRVKRRLQRFISRASLQLKPGDSGQLADGRAFKVVEAVQVPDGRCEFLAVAPLVAAEPESPEGHTTATPDKSVVLAEQLPLPYTLPG
jgi:tRNA-modifying protein YgfZ